MTIRYIGGYPTWSGPRKATVSVQFGIIEISDYQENKIEIHKNQIKAIYFSKNVTRSAGKAATGAIVGGLLTGGIGLIAGGAIGGRKKDNSEILIDYDYQGHVLTIRLETGKDTNDVYSELNSVFAQEEKKQPKFAEREKIERPKSDPSGTKAAMGCLIGVIVIVAALFIWGLTKCSSCSEQPATVPLDTISGTTTDPDSELWMSRASTIAESFIKVNFKAAKKAEFQSGCTGSRTGNSYILGKDFKLGKKQYHAIVELQYNSGQWDDANNWEYGDITVIDENGKEKDYEGTLNK